MSISHIAVQQIQKATHQNGCYLWLFYSKKRQACQRKTGCL